MKVRQHTRNQNGKTIKVSEHNRVGNSADIDVNGGVNKFKELKKEVISDILKVTPKLIETAKDQAIKHEQRVFGAWSIEPPDINKFSKKDCKKIAELEAECIWKWREDNDDFFHNEAIKKVKDKIYNDSEKTYTKNDKEELLNKYKDEIMEEQETNLSDYFIWKAISKLDVPIDEHKKISDDNIIGLWGAYSKEYTTGDSTMGDPIAEIDLDNDKMAVVTFSYEELKNNEIELLNKTLLTAELKESFPNAAETLLLNDLHSFSKGIDDYIKNNILYDTTLKELKQSPFVVNIQVKNKHEK